MPIKFSSTAAFRILWTLVFFFFTGILIFQYFFNRSLWLDESMLALNIVDRGYRDLLKPLDYSQVAPILFLLIEKLFTQVFGNGELGLRLFPLLCSIASLALIYILVKALTKNKAIALIALFILGCSPIFIYYSSEVKQYAVDVFVMLSIFSLYFADHLFLNKRRPLLLAIAGAIAVFLSNTSVIVLFIIGILVLVRFFLEKKIRINLLLTLFVWGIFFAINYLLFIKGHPTEENMKAYWSYAFMPLTSEFPGWLDIRVKQVFFELLPIPDYHRLFMILYLASLLQLLIKEKFTLVFICVAPIIIHLALSAVKMYPFDLRLILYQAPLYIIVIANGLYQLSQVFRKWPAVQYGILSLCTLIFALRLFDKYPAQNEEIRPVIICMNPDVRSGQTLYVYYGSKPAYAYYKRIGVAKFGDIPVIMGESHAQDNNGFLTELQPVSGKVWLLFSHVYPFDGSRGEEMFIIKGLQQRGRLIKDIQSYGSSAYLFELKSSEVSR